MTTEDNCTKFSSSSSTDSSSAKQRRKRKWDQPAESLLSTGIAVSGVFPLGNVGSPAGITLPGVAPGSGTSAMSYTPACSATLPQVLMVPSLQQHAADLVKKINQTKIQEELIAREIVINDAESSIRYKLTKRQTQEEIQKCTGSVVITRGKYRLPNGPPDGEKPLYLHISAGAHLETTADRIKAVDHAAAMVEEMLKQGSLNNGLKVTQPLLSTCVFLGFEADPSLNIVDRIRGPNDQYVNHIMNETGATVLLRGLGSKNPENSQGEEGPQQLHLFLSSNNSKSLEHAKRLAENLLDTICAECGASRISSCKVYGAVPPPTTSLTAGFGPVPGVSSATAPGVTTSFSQALPNIIHSYSQPLVTGGGTSYNGYGGIYPQATPLQQVALALRQSASPITSTVSPVATAASTASSASMGLPSEREKHRPQKRKFQELPVTSKGPPKPHQNLLQDSVIVKPRGPTPYMGGKNISTMPPPKKLTQQAIDGLTPPPRSMPPPPPSPKFTASKSVTKVPEDHHVRDNTKSEDVPDTLIQLMAYGDDDDDDLEETTGEPLRTNSSVQLAPKPFWAV